MQYSIVIVDGINRNLEMVMEMTGEISEILASAHHVLLPAKSSLFQQGQDCDAFYVLLEGSIRVFARSGGGSR